jgi:pimeloyl-ACP methyl ester carboxylesterase
VSGDIVTRDHWVAHVSTVPAIAGETMRQFLREKASAALIGSATAHAPEGRVVLMVHGGFWPSTAAFDLPFPDMSWMEALAREGFDVFTLDMTGHGRSALALQEDPRNLSPAGRAALAPGILDAAHADAPAPYPFELVTSDTESADLDAVVDFIRALRGVDRVKLLGWSGGGIRTGTYALRHPEKVESLVIWASSNYLADGPDHAPADLPVGGYPMLFQTRDHGENVRWRANIRCPGQVADEAIFDAVWRAGAEADPVGARWGGLRGPSRSYWGWTARGAARLNLPVLVMVGECDRLLANNIRLFNDIGTGHKAYLQIACGSHFMMWEESRHAQRAAALEWLSDATLQGASRGTFRADEQGRVDAAVPRPPPPEIAGT